VLAGSLLAVAVHEISANYESTRATAQFEAYLTERSAALEEETLAIFDALRSLKALFDASEQVTREEFSTFVQGTLSRNPAIRAMEWIPRVPGDDRQAHEARGCAAGLAEYHITNRLGRGRIGPVPQRAEYFPVFFVEPYAGNERALGFDLGSDPVRRAALDRAMATGQLALTDPIVLVQGESSSKGLLAFLPIHAKHVSANHATPADVEGFVATVFHIADLIGRARLDDQPAPLRFELISVDALGERQVLHASPGPQRDIASAARTVAKPIQMGGGEWRLVGSPTEAFLSQRLTPYPVAMAAGVFALMAALGSLVFFLAKRTRELATGRQDRMIRTLLGNVVEGVVVADREGKILLVNAAAERMVRMTADSARPGGISAIQHTYLPDMKTPYPEDQLPLARAIRGETATAEVLFVRHPGASSGLWLSANAVPLMDEQGQRIGGVVTLRDISERVKSDELVRRLSSAVEQTADAVLITDRDGEIVYVNHAFESTTGYTSEEVLGKTPRILKSGAHDPDYYQKLWATVLEGEVFRATAVNRKKSGELYYADQTITPMKDPGGRVTHFVSVIKDMTERRRIEEQAVEMRLAAQVQQKLYPEVPPEVPGLDIAGAVFAAEATCGDYFDFIRMENDRIAVVIGDVSGHGLGPALIMSETRAFLRAFAQVEQDAAEILGKVNNVLFDDLRGGFFVTLLLAVFDLSSKRLVHASAGHTPGYILTSRGEVKHVLEGTCLPLGVDPKAVYELAGDVELEPGDLLVLITDGVTESRSPQGDFFGDDGALAAVKAFRHGRAHEIVEQVNGAVFDFRAGQRQLDDITIVVCKLDALPTT
jgi:PAS domain S-box-containing protein